MAPDERLQLFNNLSAISRQEFERLLFTLNPPAGLVPGPEASQMNRVKALLDWAEGSGGRGLDEVQACFNQLRNGTLRHTFDFSGYLKFVLQDARYKHVRDLYTETEVLIPLEAETVERQSLNEQRPDGDWQIEGQRKVKRFPVLKGLRKYTLGHERQHVLLAGRPGSGKSTTLKRMLLELAEEASVQPEIIPVFVQLKSDRTITDLILAEFRRAKVRVTPEQLDEWLLQDQLLLLLDGVNEIPSEERRRQLQDFRDDNPTTPMIFTTRDLSVGGDLSIEKRMEMRPLSEPQMREFVGKYFTNRRMPDQADALLRQLRDRLREIAETPLLLKMLCDVFDPATQQIPQSKGELFRQFDQDYEHIKKDTEYVPVSENFWEFKADILQFLAFSMIQTDDTKSVEAYYSVTNDWAERLLETWLNVRGVSDPATKAKLWLKDLRRCHFLQVAKDPGDIEFHHQLFQEYYAAEYLLQLLPNLSDEELKRDYLNLLKWTEPIALMLALVDEEEQALRLVKLAMDDVDLMLGARLAGKVKQRLQPKLIQGLNNLPVSDGLKIYLWGQTQTFLASTKILSFLGSEDFNLQYIMKQALAGISTDELACTLKKYLGSENILVCLAAIEALGITASKKGIDALINLLSSSVSEIRRATASALGQIGSELAFDSLVLVLQEDPSASVRSESAKALGKIGSKKAIPILTNALQDKGMWVANNAVYALGELGVKEAMPLLTKMILFSDPKDPFSLRDACIRALKQIGIDHTIQFKLSKALADSSSFVRENAAYAIGGLECKRFSGKLLELLGDEINDDNFYFQIEAVCALGKIKSLDSEPILIEKLKSNHPLILSQAVVSLGLINSQKAMPRVQDLLHHDDPVVRANAVFSLRSLKAKATGHSIVNCLTDKDAGVRRSAILTIQSLKLGENVSESQILEFLSAENDDINRSYLLAALPEINRSKAFSILFKHTKDPSSIVRIGVLKGFRKLSGSKVREAVCSMIEDSDEVVSLEAAYTLSELGDAQELPKLIGLLKKTGRAELVDSIFAIQNRYKFYNYEIFHSIIPPGKTISLYFSYALADEPLQTQLANHLTLLERQGVITSWSQRQILPGDEPAQVINQQLNTADIILLLISANSLADDTCYNLEIQRAIERHQVGEARVIPILLRPVDWAGAPFSQIEVLPRNHQPVTSWDNPDEAFREIAEGIRAVAMEVRRVEGEGRIVKQSITSRS